MDTGRFTTAAILAGGQSRRMGYDKFNLRIGGRRLIDVVISTLRQEFDNIIVVANSDELILDAGVTLVRDEFAGCGPLAGIHAALRQAGSEYVYFMACDMPSISIDYIRHMKALAGTDSPDLVAGLNAGRPEPFHAFYARRIVPALEKRLADGQLRLQDLISQLDGLFVDETQIRTFSPDLGIFANINTEFELAAYLQNAEGRVKI